MKPREENHEPYRYAGELIPRSNEKGYRDYYVLQEDPDVNGFFRRLETAISDPVLLEAAKRMHLWMLDMVSWGKAAREDIIALEAACGIPNRARAGAGASDDPGDPPPVVWGDD